MIDDPLIGYQIGNYRIERLIGQGGMAQVYYGWDQGLHRPVAVKVIDARLRGNLGYAQRFIQEARSVATWHHKHILQVFYAGDDNGLYYFAMEYIDGLDLGQLIAQYVHDEELLPYDDVLKIGTAIAHALDYAHEKGVIHRDVKPSNVMLARDGRIVLADFGLAMDIQQGSMGEVFGTPHYIAPEQARNSATAVTQSDLYSLGVILYEMLTGILPFDDPSPTSLAVQHITLPPPPPRVVNPALNEATEAVLLKALAKTPDGRYQTGTELLNALEDALKKGVATAVSPTDSNQQPAPLPAGFTPPPPRSLSNRTVAERVSLLEKPELPPVPAPVPLPSKPSSPPVPMPPSPSPMAAQPSPPPPAATPSPAKKKTNPWLIPVGIVILLIVAYGIGRLLSGGDEPDETAVLEATAELSAEINLVVPDDTPTEEAIIEPTVEPIPIEDAIEEIEEIEEVEEVEEIVEIEEAAEATEVPPPTEEPTLAPTDVPPTDIPPAEPTIAPEPTAVPPTSIPEPTTAYPNGRRVILFYNENSFYFYNSTNNRIDMRPISFEAIDENGDPLRYRFNADKWTQFYTYVDAGNCNAVEIYRESGYLNPPQCASLNATVTPERDTDEVFWINKPGTAQIRISWNGNEIARCELDVERCVVFLPQP